MDDKQNSDLFFMRAAISEAHSALENREVPIGAVVVCRGRIVGRGANMVERLSDATAHAEMQAITAATHTLGGKYLRECTLYVTVEPCVMCAGAIAWSQLGRVVYGAADPKRGFLRFGREMLHPKTELTGGVLEEECGALVADFFAGLRR